MRKLIPVLGLLLILSSCNSTRTTNQPVTKHVLVFTKTMGWRHGSIEKGVSTLKEIGAQEGWQITQSEDSLAINTENLAKTDLVIFLSTTGDILGSDQEAAFKNYIQNGGAFMGIHAARMNCTVHATHLDVLLCLPRPVLAIFSGQLQQI